MESHLKRILPTIAGVVQVPIIALHVAMFFGMAKATEIPVPLKPLLHIFNAAVLTTVIFFAYISLFRRRELLETPLGRAVCWFIAVFYLQRGLTEVVVSGFRPVTFGILLAVAALYAIAAAPPWPRRATTAATSAA